jgi:hypothetical protein
MDDVVYLCRPGENEELRYSLRSLRNLPHGKVWIFGGAPDWVNRDRVNVIEVPQEEFNFRQAWLTKYLNVRRNLTAAVRHKDVSANFTYMNDDFYVTEAIDKVPILNYGTREQFGAYYLAHSKVPSNYVQAEFDTLDWVSQEFGIEDPLSYALHVPLPVKKASMEGLLQILPETLPSGQPAHLRTAYGNAARLGGKTIRDVKVERGAVRGVRRLNGQVIDSGRVRQELPKPFASSSDRSFISNQFPIGKWIRAMFAEPSEYEL